MKRRSPAQIADAMGHKKTSTTEIYVQRFNGDQADEKIRQAMRGRAWNHVGTFI